MRGKCGEQVIIVPLHPKTCCSNIAGEKTPPQLAPPPPPPTPPAPCTSWCPCVACGVLRCAVRVLSFAHALCACCVVCMCMCVCAPASLVSATSHPQLVVRFSNMLVDERVRISLRCAFGGASSSPWLVLTGGRTWQWVNLSSVCYVWCLRHHRCPIECTHATVCAYATHVGTAITTPSAEMETAGTRAAAPMSPKRNSAKREITTTISATASRSQIIPK